MHHTFSNYKKISNTNNLHINQQNERRSNTQNQIQALNNSTCSSQSSLYGNSIVVPQNTSNQFQTINNIYQLHSIINRISIQKQKYRIAYTSSIRMKQQANYQNQMLCTQIQEHRKKEQLLYKQLDSVKQKLQLEIDKSKKLSMQRDNISKMLDTVVQIQSKESGQKVTVSTIISEYRKLKSDTLLKAQTILKQNSQILTKQLRIKDLTAQIQGLKHNFTSQTAKLSELVEEQNKKYNSFVDNSALKWQKQKFDLMHKIQQLDSIMKQLQHQNRNNLNQISQYHDRLSKYEHERLQRNMIEQVQKYIKVGINQKCNNSNNSDKQKILLLEQRYQYLLHQNCILIQQTNTKKNENLYLLNKIQNCIKQNEQLSKQIALVKQQNEKLQTTMLQLQDLNNQSQKYKIKLPSDRLAKIQGMKHDHQKQKNKFNKQIQHLQNLNIIIKQRSQDLTKQVMNLKIRINHLQSSNDNYHESNQVLIDKNDRVQQQNFNIKLQNKRLQVLVNDLQISVKDKIRRIKQQQTDKDLNILRVSKQNYEQMMIKLKKQEDTNFILETQKIQYQNEAQSLQRALTRTNREKTELQIQLSQVKQKLKCGFDSSKNYSQSIQKLQSHILKSKLQHDIQIFELINKIDDLKQNVHQLKQINSKYEQLMKNKKKNISVSSDMINLKIFPYKKIVQASKLEISQSMRNKFEIIKNKNTQTLTRPSSKQFQLSSGKIQDIKKAYEIIKRKQNGGVQQRKSKEKDGIFQLREKKFKTQNDELDKTIQNLKKQKRELSKGKII